MIHNAPVPGQAEREYDDEALRLVCEREMSSFAEVERDAAWCTIGLHWVFKMKTNKANTMIKHKAWFVTKGYVEKPNIDFDEVFAPVAHLESM